MSQPSTITIKTPSAPATPKQVEYLKSLMEKKDNEDVIDLANLCIESNILTKGNASKFIDKLVASPWKKKTLTSAAAAYKASFSPAVQEALAEKKDDAIVAGFEKQMPTGFIPAPEKPVEVAPPAYGYYNIDGTLYCYDEFKQKYGTKVKVMKLKKTTVWSHKEQKYVPKGKWIYWANAYTAKNLFKGKPVMTKSEAMKQGMALGFCIRCGRTLTDPFSVANGIGPVCVTYPGWGIG